VHVDDGAGDAHHRLQPPLSMELLMIDTNDLVLHSQAVH
jgi:hypothetical protein